METMEALTMMITMPVMFGWMGWMAKIFLDFLRHRRMSTMMYEVQNKVIDKFGTAGEALEYLESDAGRKLLESASIGETHPRMRVLSSIRAGLILGMAAVGFLLVRGVLPDAEQGMTVIGILVGCVAGGFLLSAGVSYWLSRSWGLINGGVDHADLGV